MTLTTKQEALLRDVVGACKKTCTSGGGYDLDPKLVNDSDLQRLVSLGLVCAFRTSCIVMPTFAGTKWWTV